MVYLPAQDFICDPDDLAPQASIFEQDAVSEEPPQSIEAVLQRHEKGHFVYSIGGMCVCYFRGAAYALRPGTGIWIPAGVEHKIFHAAGSASGYLFLRKENYSMPSVCSTMEVNAFVLSGLRRLAETDPFEQLPERQELLLGILLDELRDGLTKPPAPLPMPDDPRLKKVANSIRTNPSENISMETWAERLFMSTRTLARLVMKETGMTFTDWTTQLRILSVLHLLAGRMSINAVAARCGYTSPSAFSAMFRRQMNMTPQQYRDACRA